LRTRVVGLLIAALVLFAVAIPVRAAAADEHWVLDEMASFKRMIAPAAETASAVGPITQEEWRSFHETALNEQNLDKPIDIGHWATLLKLTVRMPKDRIDFLLEGYAYTFDKQGRIEREDAVAGLVKLLSVETMQATWSHGEADPSKTIRDAADVDDMQLGLFYIAYREGILDAKVTDAFRPKEWLTNAEALSMASRVVSKFGAPVGYDVFWPENHWSAAEMKTYLRDFWRIPFMAKYVSPRKMPVAERLDRPISPEDWHQMLVQIGSLPPGVSAEDVRRYTTDLAEDGRIERGHAIAALIRLYGPQREATPEELAAYRERFADAAAASEPGKLAIAASLGLARGEASGLMRPDGPLTVAEAYVLAVRAASVLAPGK